MLGRELYSGNHLGSWSQLFLHFKVGGHLFDFSTYFDLSGPLLTRVFLFDHCWPLCANSFKLCLRQMTCVNSFCPVSTPIDLYYLLTSLDLYKLFWWVVTFFTFYFWLLFFIKLFWSLLTPIDLCHSLLTLVYSNCLH